MSAQRVELEPAYILHTRVYRETSQLLEVITPSYGRVGLVANGARRPKSMFRGYLNPFQPLRLSWTGRSELMRLSAVENAGAVLQLPADSLLSGFYANELLLKLLERGDGDTHQELFVHYSALVDGLAQGEDTEFLLRRFEMALLTELGYALNLDIDCVDQQPLVDDALYEVQVERGLVPVEQKHSDSLVLSGAELLAISRLDLSAEQTRKSAKVLLRFVLNYHLGGRTLKTRQVAASMHR